MRDISFFFIENGALREIRCGGGEGGAFSGDREFPHLRLGVFIRLALCFTW